MRFPENEKSSRPARDRWPTKAVMPLKLALSVLTLTLATYSTLALAQANAPAAPSGEATKSEAAPKIDVPKSDVPKSDVPKSEQPQAERPVGETEPKRRRKPKKPAEAAPAKPAVPPAAVAIDDLSAPIIEQLSKAGVKGCLPGMASMGKETMSGVTSYGRAANWQSKAPDQRLASVILGQTYPEGAPLPKAFAVVLGAPAAQNRCDTYAVQVIPSKEKCSDLQTKITVRGKKLGDLSGIPFLNDVNKSQIMLLPSAGDGCVLVALRIQYAE